MRVFIAALATESNSFAPFPTGLRAFEDHGLVRKGSCAGEHTGVRHVAANPFAAPIATLRLLAEAAGYDEVIESPCAFAQPAGPTVGVVYEHLRDQILADLGAALQARPIDLVLLDLHGAMRAEGHDDCEGELVGRVRRLLPHAVIAKSNSVNTP